MSTPFVTELEELGYFNGLEPESAEALKEAFEQSGWLGIFSESHRFFMADAEDLAEGGIGRFLQEISPFLALQGVALPEIEEEMSEEGYVVRVGGADYQIYDAADMERDASGEESGLIWGLSMVHGFRIADELLAAAGSAERAYAVNGGNDLFVLFLTPELHRVIMEHPDASRCDGPYVPHEEYPLFGQPEEE